VAGEPHHVSAFRPAAADPSEPADRHIVPELLQAENDRLRQELRRAEAALRVAAKVLSPYLKAPESTR
jgi:hypothetical protein